MPSKLNPLKGIKQINKDEEDEKKKALEKLKAPAPIITPLPTVPKATEVKTSAPSPVGNATKTTTATPNANVESVFSKTLSALKQYAMQGPEQLNEVAGVLSGNTLTTPGKNGLNYWSDEASRSTIVGRQRMLRDMSSFFNDEKYALNPQTTFLSELPFLKQLKEQKQMDWAKSLVQDDFMKASKEQNAEQEVSWQNLYKATQEEKDFQDEWYNLLLADHLLHNSDQLWDYEAADARYCEDVMDDATYDSELKRLRDQMKGIDWATKTGYNTSNYESQTALLKDQISLLDKTISDKEVTSELETAARLDPNFGSVSKYTGDLLQLGTNDDFMYSSPWFYINNAGSKDFYSAVSRSQVNWTNGQIENQESPYWNKGYEFMDPYEVETYNYYYQTDKKKAADYLAAKETELAQRRNDSNSNFWGTLASEDGTALFAYMLARGQGVLNFGDKIQQTVAAATGQNDPNASYYDEENMKQAVDSTIHSNIGDVEWLNKYMIGDQNIGQHIFNAGTGFIDSAIPLVLDVLMGGTGNVNKALMAGQAYSSGLQESGERGLSPLQTLVSGMSDAAWTTFVESLGVDPSVLTGKNNFVTNFLSEGGEELIEALGSDGKDRILSKLFGSTNKYEDYVSELRLHGIKNPEDVALKDKFTEYLTSFVYGGAAGGMMGLPGNIADYTGTRSIGKAVIKDGDIDTIVKVAQGMPAGSESKQIVDEITAKQGKGKKPSFYQFGQLTKAIAKDLGDEKASIVNRVQEEAIANRLQDLGDDPTTAKKNAVAIRKLYRGELLNMDDRATVNWNDNAKQVVQELSRETKDVDFAPGAVEDVGASMVDGKWVAGDAKDIEASRTGNKWVQDMKSQQLSATSEVQAKLAQVNLATITPIGKAANRAEEAAKKRVPKQNSKITKATDTHVTFRGSDGSTEVSGDILRFEDSEEGMNVVVQTGKGKEGEQKVKLEDWINADGDGIATILSYIGDEQLPHSVTADEANTLMQVYKVSGGNAKAVIQAFDVNYLAGYSGIDQIGSALDPGLANIAYENGKLDAEKYEAERVQRAQQARKVETPTVGWIGDVSDNNQIHGRGDSAALDEAVKGMTDGQRYVVEYGKALAKKAHINVVFFNSKADPNGKFTADNGRYDPNTHTIYLDINAGHGDAKAIKAAKNKGTLGYAVMRTLGHEVTHAIESTSVEYYAKYKQAVKDALKAKGKDWATLVRDRIDEAIASGQKMTYGEAESEIVADASEYMLQDADFSKDLDTGIVNKIKTVVKNFVTTINDIFRELAKTGSVESYTLRDMRDGVYHYMDGLQELWGAAFEDMTGAEGTMSQQDVEAHAAKVQSSVRRDAEYMEAVKNNDVASAQKMVDEVAVAAGYTPLKLYHGTQHFGFKKFDINRMDDKMSIFVTDNERIAESYSGENPNRSLKNSVNDGNRYDYLNRPAKELESLVREHVDKNLRVPTDKELRQFTDFESSTILTAVDRVNEYIKQHSNDANFETRQALQNIVYYGEKLAQIPYADLEDETDAYKLRMKYSDAVLDLSFADRDVYDALAPLVNRPVVDSANNLITARFNDPFYNEQYATFTPKYNVTDKLGDKLFKGVYDLYADQTNLLDIDANDANWNTISGELIGRPGVFVATRDVAKYAKDNGYRGAVIRNVRDSGGMTAYSGASDVYIFFDNTSLKSADPVTYDDDGNVIPLSERFNVNEADIRHSRRRDYQYTVDGARDFFQDSDTYHNFAETANRLIAANPRKKMHVFTITEYDDDTFLCVVVNDGNRKFHLEDVAFIDLKEYTERNGNAYKLTDQIERMYIKYGKERTAELMGLIDPHVRGRFFAIDRGHGNRPIQARAERSEKDSYFEQSGRTAGERDQRGGLPEGTGEVNSPDGISIDKETKSASPVKSSARTWRDSDYVTKREEMAQRLSKSINVPVETARKWIDDVNSISAYVLANKARVDYIPTAVKGVSAFKSNPEYGGSIDMSTICAKRRLATGTLDAIQRVLGDEVLTKDDFLRIREMMKEREYEVACGLCFVESSRKNLSKYNAQFMEQYNRAHPDGEISMTDLNTVDGLEALRLNNEDAYAEYEKFMNKLAQRKPKLFEKRTEYNHEILKKFRSDTTVDIKNLNGGLRLQSFSDFEIVHLIDMMQVITDMASVGLAGQAYTKVPDFAWALGDTGLKINLSLIAKDVDADGNLIFDDVEGMNHNEAKKLRDAYSKNVGTIVVTFTDEQLLAAMKSDMVDYIIPFHRSQWQKGDYKKLGLPEGTKDYTLHQNEKQGRKRVKENLLPNAYWDFSLSGKENAEKYLSLCAASGRTPKFAKFLVNNGDGTYSLQPDGSTDGYWKLLIDFKMYDNQGNGSPQLPVQPNFNMNEAMRMLKEYKGEHDSFPVAQDVVDDFVKEYRGDKGGVQMVDGRYMLAPVQSSARRNTPDELTTRDYLAESDDSIAETVEERNALTIYQKLLKNHAAASETVIAAEQALETATEPQKDEARKVLSAARAKQRDLYNRLLNVERTAHVQSVISRTNQFMTEELHGKTRAAVEKAIAAREAKIAELKADLTGLKGAAKTQREADIRQHERIVARFKSKAAQMVLDTSEKYQRQIADIRLRRDINIEVGKKTRHIKRVVKALNDRIVHEEDYKNVKEPLKPAVHTLVRTFVDGFGNLVFDQKTADRLRGVYDAIADENAAPDFYSDDVANWLSDLASMKELDAIIRAEGSSSLSAAEEKLFMYSRVADIADHIYKMVTNADEIFINGKRASIAAVSGEVGDALVAKPDKPMLVGKARDAVRIADDLLRTGNMTPQYFFDHLKNSGLTKLFDGLMDGQQQYAQAIREGQEVVAAAKDKYNFYSWQNMKEGVEFRTEQGHRIALTVPQMMWVYATAKREATNTLMDTHHLDQGGFRYESNALPREKGKMTAIPGSDKLHKLSAKDVAKITDTLTAEQKACADELVGYLSEDCAEMGNEASMKLFGIKKYNEEYYFPFKTAGDQRYQRSDAGSTSTTNDARVKHASFTHSLRKGANTPLVMGDFFDVIADHINMMATYSSFVVPIESMNRVLNTKVNEDADGNGNDVTIRSLVGTKYGEPAQKYIADLMKDLNGGPQTDNRGGISALFRAFKRGAVLGSLSVSLQQPTAIARAMAYVNPKYFLHLTGEGNKKTWERMMRYSGTTVIKDMGKFDVGTGKMANDWIANSDLQSYNVWKRGKFLLHTEGWNAVKNNYVDFLTALPGVMDRVTWTHIWKAIEAEQADLNPSMDRNSDDFLTTVGKRFDDVINHTQVYDSILAKSQNMRSKNPLTQMSTAFMSEPTLNINMLYDAVRGEHDAPQRAAIITSVIASNILAAAMASLISAWNKDDDERKLSEKYLTEFANRAIESVNPLTMIPYVADLWSMINGYDIERTDWSVVKDILDYGSKFFSNARDPEKANTWRDYENFFGTIANLLGVPAKNISRDIRRVRNLIMTDKSAASGSSLRYSLLETITPFGLYASTNTSYYERLLAATMDGDKQEQYDLKDYLMSTKGVKESSITSGVRDAYKKVYLRGGIDKKAAVNFLLANNLVSGKTETERKQNAFEYVDKWEEGTDGYSAYNTLRIAFSGGNSATIQSAWNELKANGWSDEAIGTYARNTIIKGMVTSGQITASKATELIRKWYPYKKDSDNISKPLEWLADK